LALYTVQVKSFCILDEVEHVLFLILNLSLSVLRKNITQQLVQKRPSCQRIWTTVPVNLRVS